jgi:hypothetical protein
MFVPVISQDKTFHDENYPVIGRIPMKWQRPVADPITIKFGVER